MRGYAFVFVFGVLQGSEVISQKHVYPKSSLIVPA